MPTEMPDAGGETELQGAYTILSSESTVELKGATDVQDVQEVLVQAQESKVVYTLRFLPEAYVPSLVSSLCSAFAGYFNAIAKIPNVVAVSTFQDINHADQLQDAIRIVVRSTSGRTSYTLDGVQFGRRVDWLAESIAGTVGLLDQVEAGH